MRGFKMNKLMFNAILVAAVVGLSGCASFKGAGETKTVVKTNSIDPQMGQLVDTANQVSSQLDRLLRLERGIPETGVATAPTQARLKTMLTVKWSGTGEDLAKGVAEQIGFRFVRSGSAPFTPIIVPLDGQDRSAETVLRIVADRMSRDAEVRVSEKQKLIEIAYRKN
jgi:hypothetical protein